MRIGMMADTYKPHVSGVTNYIDLNKRHLERAGHEVFVFSFGDMEYRDEEPRIVRSPGVPLPNTGFFLSFRYTQTAKNLLQSMDIIHVHHPFLSGSLALRYARPLQIPIVFTNHTRYDLYAQVYMPLMPEEISDSLLRTYMPNFCNAVDLVVAPSNGLEKVLNKLDVKSPIVVIPNGVELDNYLNAQPLPRADFGYTSDDIIFISVGRLGPEKNLAFLLRAFNGLAQAYDHVRLLILGDGPSRADLEALVSSLAINDRVRFEGLVNYDKIPSYLSMCDVFVTASVTETFGMSVVEAMGTGLPVLGVDSVGVGDIVLDEVTGYLTSEDPIAYAVKMTLLATEEGLRKKMSAAAREESRKYSIVRTGQMMQQHYERLVAEAKPRHHGLQFRVRSLLQKLLK